MAVHAEDFEHLKRRFTGELLVDDLSRRIYSTDASVYQELPHAVAIPKTDDDILALIRFANQSGIGLIPRTAGTSLAGQVVGSGIVVDVSKHFTQILEFNAEESWVRVQPGVIRDELNLALRPHDVLFGPETSTANRAMIGGMLGNNSCGANSIVYGSTRDHVIELTGFLSDGSKVTFNGLTPEEVVAKSHGTTLEATIYKNLTHVLGDERMRSEIVREFPKPTIHRRNTGYAIDSLLDCAPFGNANQPFNLCRLIAGSEGTLFFATEIKLGCCPLPPPVLGLQCSHFRSVDAALRATQIAMKHKPWACELIDHLILEGAARNLDQNRNRQFVDGEPAAILLTEVRAGSQHAVLEITQKIETEFKVAKLGYRFPVLFDDDANRVWDLRKAGLGIIGNVPGDRKPVACIEDTAVDVNDLAEYIRDVDELLKTRHGVICVHYAHAGAGEIHLRPVLNLKSETDQKKFHEITADVAELVKKYRGSLSGEHGDGRLRGEFIRAQIGQNNFELLRQIKKTWDPKNIFNPNKIVNAPPMDQSLRYQPNQQPLNLTTIFDFGQTGGMLRASEMCSGSGDCRKTNLTGGGTMCPSYMATRNEADTTRARANLLRQALTHPIDAKNPLNNPDVLEILDLCLSCKGCRNECPSNVDMAKMKAEFLQGYYDANGIPFRTRLIANFSHINRWTSRFPGLYNFFVANKMTGGWFKKLAGFHVGRSLPRLSKQTLRRWFSNHRPHPDAGSRGSVFLYCDEFTNFNDLSVGIASVELLERLGWSVEIPEHVESGRASISKGYLRKAREIAEQNISLLAMNVSADKPLIGLEPSALLTFRDEYPQLVGEERRSQAVQLAENCLLIDEFLDQQELDPSVFTENEQTIRLHGHCHQKALASLAPTVRMLQLPMNFNVRLIPSGCCGMAGSFGYEREHYDLSQQIGELVLFPTIRNEPPENLIAAAGTSCRHQILDGTGRQAFHPVTILRDALK